MYLWISGGILTFFLIRLLWRVYMHPAHTLGRQAANMGWILSGASDIDGYKNSKMDRDGMQAIISFKNGNVLLMQPLREAPFKDFIELERWLVINEQDFDEDSIERIGATDSPETLISSLEFDENDIERMNVTDNTDAFISSVDAAVKCTGKFLLANKIYMAPEEGEGAINIIAPQLVYIASYIASLNSDEDIPWIIWNTYKAGIENRILATIENPPKLYDTTVTPDGTTRHTSYVSSYYSEMDDMEMMVRNNRNDSGQVELHPLTNYFLGILGCNNLEYQSKLQRHLLALVEFSSEKIVPGVAAI